MLYKKHLTNDYEITPPSAIGGLKSEEYLKLNPQGKMPLLAWPDGHALPESEVIVQYLLDKHRDRGKSRLLSII